MKDTESYVNVAELKRKIRAWFSSHETSKQVREDFFNIIKKLPVTAKGNLEVTLDNPNGWISVKERMPEKDGDFLCLNNGEIKILPYGNGEFYITCFDAVLRCCNSSVTHWMPLPEPPESEGDAE